MSTPQQPAGRGPNLTLLVVLVVVGMSLLCCCGGLPFGLFLMRARVQTAIEEMPKAIQLPTVTARPDANDWMTARALAPVYSTSLDAVTTDKNIIERLGQPIGPSLETDDLFRRKTNEDPDRSGEKIEFDIKGPKGWATVTAVTSGSLSPPSPATSEEFRVAKITVTFKDGSVIDVPPPSDQPAFLPVR